MIERYFVNKCYKVDYLIDAYGDYVDNGHTTEIPCRFRYISSVNRGSNSENNETDAMLWVAPTTDLERGDYILYDSLYYKIERLNQAIRLGETRIQFLKCELKEVNIGIS